MKTIFLIVLLTVVYVVGMTKFTDNQDYLNASRLAALEHQYDMSFNFSEDYFEEGEFEDNAYVLKVSFKGEVKKETEVNVPYGTSLSYALELAGGLLSSADTNAINLSYIIEEDRTFYIPKVSNETKVSINKATAEELDNLPAIGSVTSNKIIAYREINGFFKSIEDIKKVSGIGETTFEKIKDLIIL